MRRTAAPPPYSTLVMTGTLCDKKITARVKRKVFKTAVRPAMLYGLETMAATKRQEAELEIVECGVKNVEI